MAIKDVRRDGNCLLWAVIISYLEQVKTNEEQFKNRYTLLFGVEKGWQRIFNFSDFIFNRESEKLVKVFRKRICDYIEDNLDSNRPSNKADFRSMLLDSEINKKNRLLEDNNDEEQQIKTTWEQMRKNGEITGSVEIEAICNMLSCNIIRYNKSFSVAANEAFQPDDIIVDNEIKLYYENGHYQYFSNIDNKIVTSVTTSNLQQTISSEIQSQSDDFLNSARLEIRNQLLDKDINEENYNAVIDIFIEDIAKSPIDQKNKVLAKSIFELKNQDQLFENPYFVFESSIKSAINKSETNDQEWSKQVNQPNYKPLPKIS